MPTIVRYLLRNGYRKGLSGGSNLWLVLGGIGVTLRVVRWMKDREVEVVHSQALKPGEAIIISHGLDAQSVRTPPGVTVKGEGRRARRAGRAG